VFLLHQGAWCTVGIVFDLVKYKNKNSNSFNQKQQHVDCLLKNMVQQTDFMLSLLIQCPDKLTPTVICTLFEKMCKNAALMKVKLYTFFIQTQNPSLQYILFTTNRMYSRNYNT